MPKYISGVLIKCEKTIKIFILSLPGSKEFVMKDLDDYHLIIKETALGLIQEEVFKMQDKNAYNPIEILNT